MQWFKLVLIGMLLGGTSAFADLSPGGDKLSLSQDKVLSWTARLNRKYSDLKLRARTDIDDEIKASGTLYELETLEAVLRDNSIVPAARLVNLACARAYCHQE